MSYILESIEVEAILPFFGAAVLEAAKSPCQKSQRGVVIYRDGVLLSRGHNRPKDERSCIVPICHRICDDYCNHAEKNALLDAEKNGIDVQDANMLHVKVKGGELVTSKNPSCLKCSTLVTSSNLASFILWTSEGFEVFGAREFYQATQDHLRQR